jgi:hypothetical protein
MTHYDTHQTFRGLPLTTEQEAEIRHYLKKQSRLGRPWDPRELREMLKDMLLPPRAEDESPSDATQEASAASERATALVDEGVEPIEVYEEWIAALETEIMKKDAH